MDENEFQLKIIELDKLVAILQTELKCSADARDLQAKEYERRLSDLNHAHTQQESRNAEYIRRETFDTYALTMENWRREVDMWRWVSIGIGIAGGGAVGGLISLLK